MSHSVWHLAQINVARGIAPLDDPRMADFVSQIEALNRLAEESPGFVWRLKDESGASSSYVSYNDDPLVLVNMSVWESIDALKNYAYRSAHAAVFRDRKRWFERMTPPLALWWIPAGEIPTVEEGKRRLALIDTHGPTAEAFTFTAPFQAITP